VTCLKEKKTCATASTTATLEVWFKEPFSTANPSRVYINQDAAIIQKGYLKQWVDLKPNVFNVRHKGVTLLHGSDLKNAKGVSSIGSY